ncbi:Cupin domain protein [Gemmata obscuriglobus]|uniref:Cupin domain-containing protein n=1 Tax=Gemmata obscuriglobus TaxID=114 RepID=A0A2Z3H7I8_9BACT|nr:cupin domain-containing protein [Gemmata obscuriglobus]AWM38945.1 cupin domain-containing protein [Gemmata obscuriglobus]QEG28043.1 Cupin domain protein [Gemmata obscuriglobus]VTS05614.1 Cupin OS=Cupriavidus sp. SK-3 GN=CF70_027635 PE=4 SV=1: Cupin_2 [Gemmata obscuriglobus UQM 2246]
MTNGNLLAALPATRPPAEAFEVLVERAGWKVERIVSWGHVTAPGEWFDQTTDEFVALLSGAARLQVEGEPAPRELAPGDWVFLPARIRHRVEWTDEGKPTVWLAIHAVP